MSRSAQRMFMNVAAIVGGVLLAVLMPNYVLKWGGAGSPTPGLPMPIFGGLVALIGVLGACGVNVYAGGPFDKRRDPIEEDLEDENM